MQCKQPDFFIQLYEHLGSLLEHTLSLFTQCPPIFYPLFTWATSLSDLFVVCSLVKTVTSCSKTVALWWLSGLVCNLCLAFLILVRINDRSRIDYWKNTWFYLVLFLWVASKFQISFHRSYYSNSVTFPQLHYWYILFLSLQKFLLHIKMRLLHSGRWIRISAKICIIIYCYLPSLSFLAGSDNQTRSFALSLTCNPEKAKPAFSIS